MVRAVKALIALVVAGMLALSGCSGQNPNNAAVVGGVPISVSEANEMFDVLKPYLQTPTEAGALGLLVVTRVGAQIAAEQGATFSPEEREAVMVPEGLASDGRAAGFVADYVTFMLISEQLGQEAFFEAVADVEVQVNPRFGAWNPTALGLVPDGSLSEPAPAS